MLYYITQALSYIPVALHAGLKHGFPHRHRKKTNHETVRGGGRERQTKKKQTTHRERDRARQPPPHPRPPTRLTRLAPHIRWCAVRATSKKCATLSSGVPGSTPWPRFMMWRTPCDLARRMVSITRASITSLLPNRTPGSMLPWWGSCLRLALGVWGGWWGWLGLLGLFRLWAAEQVVQVPELACSRRSRASEQRSMLASALDTLQTPPFPPSHPASLSNKPNNQPPTPKRQPPNPRLSPGSQSRCPPA